MDLELPTARCVRQASRSNDILIDDDGHGIVDGIVHEQDHAGRERSAS
jgi:hypothetical protein